MVEQKRRITPLLLIVLLAFTVAASILTSYAFQSSETVVEIKEPIEILGTPAEISLFPGETRDFNVSIQNSASVNYTVYLSFKLNDTAYQTAYVTFSEKAYLVPPELQTVDAWLKVSNDAPAATMLLTVNFTRGAADEAPQPSPTPSPFPTNSTLNPSLVLLGSGARWAAPNGTRALYVDSKDNWLAHHLTDGVDWGPWFPESAMDEWRRSVSETLMRYGFTVDFVGDIPLDISGYDLVLLEAIWAVEPKHEPLFRNFISNGGGVVIQGPVPCFFSVYCKDRWPYRAGEYPTGPGGTDLTRFKDWFGAATYVNTGGIARLTEDSPFGAALGNGTVVHDGQGYSAAAVTGMEPDARILARWDLGGYVFAFTHEYGQGRVYYQAQFDVIPPP